MTQSTCRVVKNYSKAKSVYLQASKVGFKVMASYIEVSSS